jgi:hypothetical protein
MTDVIKPKVRKVRIPFNAYQNKNEGFKVKLEEYGPLINKLLQGIPKTWNDCHGYESSIGNTGYSLADVKQHLILELFVGLTKYDPTRGAAESTFIYRHLFNRIGVFYKKYTAKGKGYGITMMTDEFLLDCCQ